MRRSLLVGIAVVALAVAAGIGVWAATGSGGSGSGNPAAPRPEPGADAHRDRPNIVFVLTDDLSWNLVTTRYMPHVAELQRRGETFSHYFVADSLCCPSRSTIFTGMFPHDTGVFTNSGSDGGYNAFIAHRPNLETETYAVAMSRAGYLTSMMGKYLNLYGEPHMTTHVPPGWSDWHVAGFGYHEFDYALNENGRVVDYGPGPPPRANARNYLTDVLSRRAQSFIERAGRARRPFILEVATFAPHAPYVPAPRNARDFPGLRAPRDSSFNTANTGAPDWLAGLPRLNRSQVRYIDYAFRRRVQADEAVDRMVAQIETTLARRGLARNTYIVFSSDNGYHMGQHRLMPGKETAFDTDIRVPLIVAGPGVPAGRTVTSVVQNTDLYPTFVQLAGGTPSPRIDGHSLVPLLHPDTASLRWRTAALVEHHGPVERNDVDYDSGRLSGNPDTYEAIRVFDRRLGNAVYVEYTDGQREYYDIDTDPYERHNRYATLAPALRSLLHRMLAGLTHCHGARACWAAGAPQTLPTGS